MIRRTTVELDETLLKRAQSVLGLNTMRSTIEEALRRVAQQGEDEAVEHRRRQLGYLEQLQSWMDPDILQSDEMWR